MTPGYTAARAAYLQAGIVEVQLERRLGVARAETEEAFRVFLQVLIGLDETDENIQRAIRLVKQEIRASVGEI